MQWLFKLIAPLIRELVYKIMDQQAEVFKWKKALDYVELPNEADKGVLKLQDEFNVLKGIVKDISKDVHPPAIDLKEWEEAKGILKKVKNMKKFKVG